MPRKVGSTAKTGVNTRPGKTARSSVTFHDMANNAMDNDQVSGSDVEAEEEDNVLEMISMLQEFQKRKASSASARSTAFQSKKNALYAEARSNADLSVKEGVAYLEQFRARIAEMKAQEVPRQYYPKSISSAMRNLNEPVQHIMDTYKVAFEELSPSRAEDINESSAMSSYMRPNLVESHASERQHSRRRIIKNAKTRMNDDLERQRLATVASVLIKHYKALLSF